MCITAVASMNGPCISMHACAHVCKIWVNVGFCEIFGIFLAEFVEFMDFFGRTLWNFWDFLAGFCESFRIFLAVFCRIFRIFLAGLCGGFFWQDFVDL